MRFLDEFERMLFKIAVLSLTALVAVQGAMTHDSLRFYLSPEERLEGKQVAIPASAVIPDHKTGVPAISPAMSGITLRLMDYDALSKARVLVNGQSMGAFVFKSVKLYVSAGDVIEIDTRAYDKPIRIQVAAAPPELRFPGEGLVVSSQQELTMIGRVSSR